MQRRSRLLQRPWCLRQRGLLAGSAL